MALFVEVEQPASVPGLFEKSVEEHPDAVALRSGDGTLTYDQVNRRANQIAHYLRGAGIRTEDRVGLFVERSMEAILAILGILKSGGAYVPLDPNYPIERNRKIMKEVQPALTLSQQKDGSIPEESGHIVYLEDLLREASGLTESNPKHTAGPNNLAYIMYTSGSTGRPKGIAGIHASITNGLGNPPRDLEIENEVWALNLSLSFGASLSRLFLPLLCGIPLVVVDENTSKDIPELLKLLQKELVTNIVFLTPLFNEIVLRNDEASERLSGIRTFVIGGAALPHELLSLATIRFPRARIVHGYALSEVGGAVYVWTTDPRTGASRARPFSNTTVHILGERLEPLEPGQVGELFVGASHLARGYYGDPALTAAHFIPDPFASSPGSRLFRTGDIATRKDNGDLVLHGRVDEQIKVRGFRVELGEVESVLLSHPHVLEAAAMLDVERDRLCAFVVPKSPALKVSELRQHAARYVPDYMVPSLFSWVHRLPRTPTGKIDRCALSNLQVDEQEMLAEGPGTFLEEELRQMWRDVLAVDRLGLNDSFFELGGHSLIAIQLMGRIHATLGVQLSLDVFLQRPTIRGLATYIATLSRDGIPLDSHVIATRDDSVPVTLQQQTCLSLEASGSSPQSLIRFGFVIESDVDAQLLGDALQRIVDRHEVLRTSYVPVCKAGLAEGDGWPAVRDMIKRADPGGFSLLYRQAVISESKVDVATLGDGRAETICQPQQIHAMDEYLDGPFDYSRPPHLRVLLVRANPVISTIYIIMPHLVADAWSTRVFVRELAYYYTALRKKNADELPPLRIQYKDFAFAQQKSLKLSEPRDRGAFEALDHSLVPFRKHHARTFGLPHNKLRRHTVVIDPLLMRELSVASQRHSMTIAMVVFTAFSLVLHKATGKKRFAIPILQANRVHPDLESLIGFIASNNWLRMDFGGNPSIQSLLAQTRVEMASATRRQTAPPEIAPANYEVHGFMFERLGTVDMKLEPSVNVRPFKVLASERPLAALKLVLDQGRDESAISCHYCDDCYSRHKCQDLLASVVAVLKMMIEEPHRCIDAVCLYVAEPLKGGAEC